MKKGDVTIQMPCGLDWRKMTPQAGGRFCGECKKVVRDLSSMSEDEARALLRGPDRGSLCVRYVYDAHGRIIFEKGVELVPAPFLSRAKRTAALLATAALPLATEACVAGPHDLNASSTQQRQQQTPAYTDESRVPVGESMGGVPASQDDDPYAADAGDAGDAADAPDAAADPDGGVIIY